MNLGENVASVQPHQPTALSVPKQFERTSVHTNKTGTLYATKFIEMDGLTVQKLFRQNCQKYGDSFHLAYRPYLPNSKNLGDYEYLKYSEVEIKVNNFSSGLRYLGMNTQDAIGVMAKNAPEWTVTDYSTACQSMVLVPVYDVYGPEECVFIITHSEMKCIVCTEDKIPFVCSAVDPKVSKLRHIILIEEKCDLLRTPINTILSQIEVLPNVSLHTFDEVMKLGKENPVADVVASPDTLLSIVYTSGTTGIPRGAVLTHRNCCAACCQIATRIPYIVPGVQDVLISYLPLAHVYEKVLEYVIATMGGVVGYASYSSSSAAVGTSTTTSSSSSSSLDTLAADVALLHPTIWPGVPRVFAKICAKVQALVALQPFYRRWMFSFAYRSKLRNLRVGKQTPWADMLVFDSIKSVMGGRVRLICNGAASLPFHIAEFVSTLCGVIVGEGYALTETCASICAGEVTAFDPHSVGHPYMHTSVCLQSIPEMGYTIRDKPYPRGEILVSGPQVFKEYFKDPEATAASLEPDGWFHTGDVGTWMPGPYTSDGVACESLHIIDRKTNIFKLAQGEFICAERLEAVLLRYGRALKQMIVYGTSSSSCLIAFVVPDWDYLLDPANREATHAEWWGGEVIQRYWDGEYAYLHARRMRTRVSSMPLSSLPSYTRTTPSSTKSFLVSESSTDDDVNVSHDCRHGHSQSSDGSSNSASCSCSTDYGCGSGDGCCSVRSNCSSSSNSGSGSGSSSGRASLCPSAVLSDSSLSLSSLTLLGTPATSSASVTVPVADSSLDFDTKPASSFFSSLKDINSFSSSVSSFSSSRFSVSGSESVPSGFSDIHTPLLLCQLFAQGKVQAADVAAAEAAALHIHVPHCSSLAKAAAEAASEATTAEATTVQAVGRGKEEGERERIAETEKGAAAHAEAADKELEVETESDTGVSISNNVEMQLDTHLSEDTQHRKKVARLYVEDVEGGDVQHVRDPCAFVCTCSLVPSASSSFTRYFPTSASISLSSSSPWSSASSSSESSSSTQSSSTSSSPSSSSSPSLSSLSSFSSSSSSSSSFSSFSPFSSSLSSVSSSSSSFFTTSSSALSSFFSLFSSSPSSLPSLSSPSSSSLSSSSSTSSFSSSSSSSSFSSSSSSSSQSSSSLSSSSSSLSSSSSCRCPCCHPRALLHTAAATTTMMSTSISTETASEDSTDVAVNTALKAYLLGEIRKVCEAHPDKIRRFEIPLGIVVCAEEWTDGNGFLTPSLKIKRDIVRRWYAREYEVERLRVESEVCERDRRKEFSGSEGM